MRILFISARALNVYTISALSKEINGSLRHQTRGASVARFHIRPPVTRHFTSLSPQARTIAVFLMPPSANPTAVNATGSVPSATNQSHDYGNPGQKRKRISHACQACRQRKSRCDGARPTCQLCSHYGLACQYSDTARPPRVASPERQTINSLEQRLHSMEGIVRALVASQTNDRIIHDHNLHLSDTSDIPELEGMTGLHLHDNTDPRVIPTTFSSISQEVSGSTDPCKAVDGMVSVTFSDEKCSMAFGERQHPHSTFSNQSHNSRPYI